MNFYSYFYKKLESGKVLIKLFPDYIISYFYPIVIIRDKLYDLWDKLVYGAEGRGHLSPYLVLTKS